MCGLQPCACGLQPYVLPQACIGPSATLLDAMRCALMPVAVPPPSGAVAWGEAACGEVHSLHTQPATPCAQPATLRARTIPATLRTQPVTLCVPILQPHEPRMQPYASALQPYVPSLQPYVSSLQPYVSSLQPNVSRRTLPPSQATAAC